MPRSGEPPALALHFERPPSLMRTYARALQRKPTALADGQTIPAMSATLAPTRPDAAHLAAFMSVCAQPPTAHLPLTYLHVLAAPLHAELLCAPSFPLRAMGLIHASNLITAWRPVRHDEAVSLHVHLDGHRLINQHTAFDLITTASVRDEIVWEQITTIISRSERRGERSHTKSPPAAGLDQVPVRSAAWALDEGLGRRYAAVSGDYNPIHLHTLGARLLGQRRAIAHGMWTAARVAAALDEELTAAPRALRIDFKRPVELPARVIFSSWRDPSSDVPNALGFDLRSADGLQILACGEASSG